MNYRDAQATIRKYINPEKAAFFPRFFKTGPGQYGEGDKFLGVTVPNVRAAIKPYYTLPLAEVEKLLTSKWHEDRLAALLILNKQFSRSDEPGQKIIYDFYLAHTAYINNWDLVDTSAEYIVGPYLANQPNKMDILTHLAKSSSLWERRIAMLATHYYIRNGKAEEALDIISILLHDEEDLIHKATGWMLREIGKRVDRNILLRYLDTHAYNMPRTTLRYAIEHLPPEQRQWYMSGEGLHSMHNYIKI